MSTRQEKFTGTKDVQEHLRFDTERLERYLVDHVDGPCFWCYISLRKRVRKTRP